MRWIGRFLNVMVAVIGAFACEGCTHLQDTLEYSASPGVLDPQLVGIVTGPSAKPETAIVRYSQYVGESLVRGKAYHGSFPLDPPWPGGEPFVACGPRTTFEAIKRNLTSGQIPRLKAADASVHWLSEAEASAVLASTSFCPVGTDGRAPAGGGQFMARDSWIYKTESSPPGDRNTALKIVAIAPAAAWSTVPGGNQDVFPPGASILIVPAVAFRPPEDIARTRREAVAAVPLAALADVGTILLAPVAIFLVLLHGG
jgi:hypothetical protein